MCSVYIIIHWQYWMREMNWLALKRKNCFPILSSYVFTKLLHNFLGHVIKSLPGRGKPEFMSHQSAARVPSAILKVLLEINGIWRAVSGIKRSWWMTPFSLLFPADVMLSGSPLAHFFKPVGEPKIWNRTLTLSLFSPYVKCKTLTFIKKIVPEDFSRSRHFIAWYCSMISLLNYHK